MNLTSQFIESVVSNPWVGFGGVLIGIIGVTITAFIYFKNKKIKSPCYTIRSNNIVRGLVSNIEQLTMFYSDEPIENLTVSKIMFWNAGRDTISEQDIANADPLMVYVKDDYKILNVKIIHIENPVNQFSISTIDDNHIGINFDYIDKDEGLIIQLFHTGKSNEDIEIQGTIKGVGNLQHKNFVGEGDVSSKIGNLQILFVMMQGLGLGLMASIIEDFAVTVRYGIYFLIFIYILSMFNLYYSKRKIPKKLAGTFDEEF